MKCVTARLVQAESRIIRWTVGTGLAVSVLIVAAFGVILSVVGGE